MDGPRPLGQGDDGFARQLLPLRRRARAAQAVYGHGHVVEPFGRTQVGGGETGEFVDGSLKEMAGGGCLRANDALFGFSKVGHSSPPWDEPDGGILLGGECASSRVKLDSPVTTRERYRKRTAS